MIALGENINTARFVAALFEHPRRFCLRLRITPSNWDDAWEVYGVVERFGGVEASEGCFAFDAEERLLAAMEVLRRQVGAKYFEAVVRHEAKPLSR
jgi:hypothetical protein